MACSAARYQRNRKQNSAKSSRLTLSESCSSRAYPFSEPLELSFEHSNHHKVAVLSVVVCMDVNATVLPDGRV
jgi:hypothetical protein